MSDAPKRLEDMTLAELHRENVLAHQRWVDAEATYARYAPWLIAIAGGCFIVGFLM